jgi:cytochrome c-type biogenesis protein CcmH
MNRFLNTCQRMTLGILLSLYFLSSISMADEAKPLADNPELEAKVQTIAIELRCLVCQNETIAGSHADLAVDLRNQIRAQLQNGKSKDDIITYMVDRYGDFVLYKPPVKSNTLVLWFGPFIILLIGLWALLRHIRQERVVAKLVSDNPDDVLKARALLSSAKKDTK